MVRPDQKGDATSREGDKSRAPKELTPAPGTSVRHVVPVMSGKGGVGKSTVAALLAVRLTMAGWQVGILDADVTGPSIPKLFGIKPSPVVAKGGLVPATSRLGIRVMSLNLLLPREDEPVIWRGPLIAGAVRQFWTDVLWGQLDCLVVDLPPGTGDAPLTVLQSIPVDGVVIVSAPQQLTTMVVSKAIGMARRLGAPILGLVENMSGVRCSRCGELIQVFGPSQARRICGSAGIRLLGVLPLDPELSRLGDRGAIEEYAGGEFLGVVASLLEADQARHQRGGRS